MDFFCQHKGIFASLLCRLEFAGSRTYPKTYVWAHMTSTTPMLGEMGKWQAGQRSTSRLSREAGVSGTSLEVQWLGLSSFTAEGTGSVPAWGTKIPHAMPCGQKKKNRLGFLFLQIR